MFVHPYYDLESATSSHDLAILLLTRQIQFTAKGITAPIRIATIDDCDLDWSSLSVAGWGDTLEFGKNRVLTYLEGGKKKSGQIRFLHVSTSLICSETLHMA